jgi:hypothetical protein
MPARTQISLLWGRRRKDQGKYTLIGVYASNEQAYAERDRLAHTEPDLWVELWVEHEHVIDPN